jgi:hypothetical protein
MASVVDPNDPEFRALSNRGAGRPAKYPWDEWLVPGEIVRLIAGEDFDCQPQTLRLMAYRQGENRNGKATVHVAKDKTTVFISFTLNNQLQEVQERRKSAQRVGVEIDWDEEAAKVDGYLDKDDIELPMKGDGNETAKYETVEDGYNGLSDLPKPGSWS